MKKRRLNKKGKQLVTTLLVILAMGIYSTTPAVGELAQVSRFWLIVCVAEFVYLFFIQFILYALVWEN